MAEGATIVFNSERLRINGSSPLGEPVDFDVKGLGRRLPRTDAPEGWIKKVERRRLGKIWVGFFHLWVTDTSGRRIRQKKEKTLGSASMPKHEAQQKLAEYIEDYTGRITKQGCAITTFADLWSAYCAVRSGQWAKKTKEDLRYLFAKHVIPVVGSQPPREVTLTSLQLLLNKMAEGGYRKSTVEKVRTHTDALSNNVLLRERVANNVAVAGEQQLNDLAYHQNIVVTVPGNTRFYIVLAKPTGSGAGAGPAGSAPAGNPGGASGYSTAATPSVQELRELMELKRELTQMYQQQQKALIAQTAAEQQ